MHVFLDFKYFVCLLQQNANIDIERGIIGSKCGIISIFHITAGIFAISLHIYVLLNEIRIEVFYQIEFTGHIDHRTAIAVFIEHHQRRNTVGLSYTIVVCTECGRNMHDTGCTFFGCHEITGNNPESSFSRIYPRQQLFILHSGQIVTFIFCNDFPRNEFVSGLIIFQRKPLGFRIE